MNIEKIREALAKVRQLVHAMRGVARNGETAIEAEIEIDKAFAELDKAQQPGKALTDEDLKDAIGADLIGLKNKDGSTLLGKLTGDQLYALVDYIISRDNGYLAPAAGLTVEEAMECMHKWIGLPFVQYDLRTRLTAAVNAKSAK